MPRLSLDSERPIMSPSLASKRTSVRMSTYSTSPSFSSATSTVTAERGRAEITEITQGLDRLENKHLSQQRFVPSPQKSEDLSKLALGAKLERALGRRMGDQDAVMRKKKPSISGFSEKPMASAKA